MGLFCDRLKLGPTAALGCLIGQNKGKYFKNKRAPITTRLVELYLRLHKIFLNHYYEESIKKRTIYLMKMNDNQEIISSHCCLVPLALH